MQPPPPTDQTSMTAAVTSVDKRFGAVQALRQLTIGAPRARITVLLGPNGAGKTTAIRLITGAMVPDAGTVRVFGEDPGGPAGESIRRRCGVVSAKPSLYDRLSGLDNLRYAAELYGLGRGPLADRRVTAAAARFGIDDALDHRVGGYSTGMKTRLALARSVLHDPELLVLDEPTSGLDPESAQAVLAMVREMTADGRTVLMCTHLLAEAEGLADKVVIMEDGTSLMWGDPTELARRYWPDREVTLTTRPRLDPAGLAGLEGVLHATADKERVRLVVRDERTIAEVVRRVTTAGIDVVAVEPHRPTLEELYFAVRREQRGEQPAPAPASADRPTADPPPPAARRREAVAR